MHLPPPSSDFPSSLTVRRDVKPLPTQLLDHSTTCFEETLYSQGFALEAQCLESGIENKAPTLLPPPSHLLFASTMAVHPQMTTRTKKGDRHIASNDALRYLRHIVNTVGVKEGAFGDAFCFKQNRAHSERSRRAGKRKSDGNSPGDEEEKNKPDFIRNRFHDKQSLWRHAEDFWAITGWAFNCSVLHKGRWERWKAWLELMLDMLQNDLEKHVLEQLDVGQSLLAQYLSTVGDGRNNRRRIMRAITADGSKRLVAEFGEIWKNETKPAKKDKNDEPVTKRRKLDIDNDEFGDYADPDSEDGSSESKGRKSASVGARSRRGKRGTEEPEVEQNGDQDSEEEGTGDDNDSSLTGVDMFGGMDSIRLRQRMLGLLTRFSRVAPARLMDTEELFSLFTEFLRPLPIPIFQQFVLPLKPYLSTNMHASLLEMMFQPLLGGEKTTAFITRDSFETNFAPHAAINTLAADNAKVGLLTESLLRALWASDIISGDLSSLRASIEKGIKAREEKVAFDGRKKVGRKAELQAEARTVLQCSAQRMRVLLDVMVS